MFTKVNSCAIIGLDGELVAVETDMTPSELPAFIVVGLPDIAVQESRERVKLAIRNSQLNFPRHKIIVNLAPADLKKQGPSYDLPIAISILKSSKQIQTEFDDSLFVGELALNGELRQTNGVLSMAIFAKNHGFKNLYLPAVNAPEASLIAGIVIYPVANLIQLHQHLTGQLLIQPMEHSGSRLRPDFNFELDMKHVAGQENVKRALEIAAAGAHNVLMSGPPGSGKTLMAKTLPSILPPMTDEEILEVTRIFSSAGLLPPDQPVINQRPFRAPHHTSSGVALVGGGRFPKPGEISLAHRGILFLDEFPEFPRSVLENLRQPLEDGQVSISRAQGTLTFPAKFTLIASQNPCPCGYASDPDQNCTCTPLQIIKYQQKISGPLLDRIDLHIEVPRVKFDQLHSNFNSEDSAAIRARVQAAQTRQLARFNGLPISYNSEMRVQEIKQFCQLDAESVNLLKSATKQLNLSARSYHRILKLARTIADLSEFDTIKLDHLAEAIQYRAKRN